ncbi:TPA: hypothetical protein R1B10_002673 [Klebsiella pneumoniae]|nr:hypothetical protein [Klebsiella pneumoniae]CDL23415.1 hypothetical protein [Klebsiella pneumoniae IS53]EIW8722843.1 hypothetical protein [Klebsiella pneumoniae]EKT5045708.1 hypothetical protein [Klebsiella pneumoniae]EKV9261772.1 hypothetical protein [Klebsiella pneumoniae]EKX4126272.1 hypothetical protein [Klebsiella pneumoniae]
MSELNKVAITKRIVHISTLDKPVEIKCCNKYHNFCSKYRLFRNIGRSEVRIPRYYTKLLKWAFYVLTIYGGAGVSTSSAVNLSSGYQIIQTPSVTNISSSVIPEPGNYSRNPPTGWAWNIQAFMNENLSSGLLGSIYASAASSPDRYCNNTLPYLTIDGYTGYEVSPGVLLIPYGSIRTPFRLSAATHSGTSQMYYQALVPNTMATGIANGSWDQKGIISGDAVSSAARGSCKSFIKGNNPINNNDWQAINYDYGTAQFNMGYGVYVSPTAAPFQKTVYIHQTYFGLLTNGMNSAVTRSFDLNLPSVNCTLNVPAVVDFGSVTSDAETAAKGISQQSTFAVNCSSTGGLPVSTTVGYSFTPKSQKGDKTSIPLIAKSGGAAVGSVRGFLGENAGSEAGCVNKNTSILMDGTPKPLRTITNNSSWSEPLFWVLCPKSDANPGLASATATLELYWQ